MAKIAVDVALLPSEGITNQAIKANKELLRQCSDRIILDKENCLPHISLAMGCIDEQNIPDIETILHTIAKKYHPGLLSVVGINIGTNSLGEKVSSFVVKKTERLLSLHEDVMRRMTQYFSHDVTAEMVLSPPIARESTLLWIKNYPENSAFDNFLPHITIGYGQLDDFSSTAEFTASKLALCHLGNHCTCRKVLTAAELE
ncbi:2'-5' RNA ligase family protein [Planctomycetota bacterium]